MEIKDKNIGIIDAGLGGLSVLGMLHQKYPCANYYYLGDVGNMPYNIHSEKWIASRVGKILLEIKKYTDTVVIACNTISSVMPMVKNANVNTVLISGAVKKKLTTMEQKEYGIVLGTKTVIDSGMYRFKNIDEQYQIDIPCVYLAKCIEDYGYKSQKVKDLVYSYLEAALKETTITSANVLIACTHYSFIKGLIEEAIQTVTSCSDIVVCDSSELFASSLHLCGPAEGSMHIFINSKANEIIENRVKELMVNFKNISYSLEFVKV